jgi:hypothetical protein
MVASHLFVKTPPPLLNAIPQSSHAALQHPFKITKSCSASVTGIKSYSVVVSNKHGHFLILYSVQLPNIIGYPRDTDGFLGEYTINLLFPQIQRSN